MLHLRCGETPTDHTLTHLPERKPVTRGLAHVKLLTQCAVVSVILQLTHHGDKSNTNHMSNTSSWGKHDSENNENT